MHKTCSLTGVLCKHTLCKVDLWQHHCWRSLRTPSRGRSWRGQICVSTDVPPSPPTLPSPMPPTGHLYVTPKVPFQTKQNHTCPPAESYRQLWEQWPDKPFQQRNLLYRPVMREQERASSFYFGSAMSKQTQHLTQTTSRLKMEISSLEMWLSLPSSSKLSAFSLQKSTSLPSNNTQAVPAHKPPECGLSGANNYSILIIRMCHTHSAWVPYRDEPKYLSACIWLHKVRVQNLLFHFGWKDGFITLFISSWRFPVPLLSRLCTLFLRLRGIC